MVISNNAVRKKYYFVCRNSSYIVVNKIVINSVQENVDMQDVREQQKPLMVSNVSSVLDVTIHDTTKKIGFRFLLNIRFALNLFFYHWF